MTPYCWVGRANACPLSSCSPDCHAALRFIAEEKGIDPTLKRTTLSGAPTPVRTMTVATG